MCGIFAYIGNKNNAGDLIINGLKTLEYRGYDSWGVAVKDSNGKLFIQKKTGKIGKASLPKMNALIGIGHTRWATHGGVTDANAHPHTDCTKEIVIVHNGIVENFNTLKKDLQQKGHTFISETDTEVIAHLTEELKKKESDEKKIVLEMFSKLQGMNAVIVFFPKTEHFFAIKNGSPVVFGKNNDEMIIASDATAVVDYTRDVYFMNDNELLELNKSGYQLYSIDGQKKDLHFTKLQFDKNDAQLGNYPHFMLKEIHEQPKVMSFILQTQLPYIAKLAELIQNAYGTYFIGCGTASYACIAGTYLFSKIAKRHVNATIASEFIYLEDFLKDTSLVVALSQSGETIDLISSVRNAKNKGAKIVSITNVPDSTLYRIADYKLLLNAGPEKGVASTKAYIAKITILYLLAYILADKKDEGIAHLKQAIQEVERILADTQQIETLAKKLAETEHMFVIGRGLSYATALESTLKIKEVSYIHAEEFAGGELKHGPIALIEKGTPVIIYNPEDETYEDSLSSAYEVKARGAYVIGISSKPNDVYDEFIQVKHCNDATIIPNVIVAQLLGYYLAITKGLDPDKPRNLAKSVTVK